MKTTPTLLPLLVAVAAIIAVMAAFLLPRLLQPGIAWETQEMAEMIRQGSPKINYSAVCRGNAGEELAELAAQYGNCKK